MKFSLRIEYLRIALRIQGINLNSSNIWASYRLSNLLNTWHLVHVSTSSLYLPVPVHINPATKLIILLLESVEFVGNPALHLSVPLAHLSYILWQHHKGLQFIIRTICLGLSVLNYGVFEVRCDCLLLVYRQRLGIFRHFFSRVDTCIIFLVFVDYIDRDEVRDRFMRGLARHHGWDRLLQLALFSYLPLHLSIALSRNAVHRAITSTNSGLHRVFSHHRLLVLDWYSPGCSFQSWSTSTVCPWICLRRVNRLSITHLGSIVPVLICDNASPNIVSHRQRTRLSQRNILTVLAQLLLLLSTYGSHRILDCELLDYRELSFLHLRVDLKEHTLLGLLLVVYHCIPLNCFVGRVNSSSPTTKSCLNC